LAAQDLTFPNKIEADARAFSLARMLIDRTLPEFDRLTPDSRTHRTTYISKMLKLARRPLAVCNIFRQYKYRN